jgi:hypothetical protein
MKIPGKVFLIIVFLFYADYTCFAFDMYTQQDTVRTKKANNELKEKTDKTNPKKDDTSPSGNADNKPGQGSIKQIKGARLDMSKARGARPPDIVRPNGSRIPQGIGKPAGAGKPGRR